ncbi:MAG TPA: hypothetical protein VMA77_00170 [Solirubrobacteraceae bacterium]|nr:hypothetical protein [Solirubrobacteraceae bacterium]
MKQILIQHGAHIGFVVIGVFVFFWMAYRPERKPDVREREQRREHLERLADEAARVRNPNHVRKTVARRGLLALGPLVGALATGAVLYGISVGRRAGGTFPAAVIWAHAGISALALLLVVYKLSDLGVVRIRRAFARQGLTELVSLGLVAVSAPLALTGCVLLFASSTGSFFASSAGSFLAYLHLISAAWWTGLLGWHLRRYLGPSLRAAIRPASADRGRLVPVEGRGEGVERRAA